MPSLVIYLTAGLLLIALAPLPYGYYVLLRLAATIVFACAAYISVKRKHRLLPWIYGLVALLFNPFIKVFLPKEVWAIVDVAAALILLLTRRRIASID